MPDLSPPGSLLPDLELRIFEATPRYQLLFLPDAPFFTLAAVSDQMCLLTGRKREDLMGKSILEVFPGKPGEPEHAGQQALLASLQQVLRSKETHRMHRQRYDLIRGDGVYPEAYWQNSSTPLFDAAGEVAYILHVAEDITERELAAQREEKILGIEKAYRLFMQAPMMIGIVRGTDHVLELANHRALQFWGKSSDILGRSLLESVPQLAEQGVHERLEIVRQTGRPYVAKEVPVKGSDGDEYPTRYFDLMYQPYYEDDGQEAVGVFTISHDVTELVQGRYQVELARKEAERQKRLYETITGSTPDLIYVFSLDYKFTYANAALLNMWGKHWNDAVGKGLLDNGYEPWHAAMHEREIDTVVATKQPIRGEVSFPHAALGKRVYDYILVPVFNEQGEVEMVAGTTRDITDLKLAEQKIRDSESKLQAMVEERTRTLEDTVKELRRSNDKLEEFAHAASHDLKEPVRKIHVFTSHLKDLLKDRLSSVEAQTLTRIENATERMEALINDLLVYSHVNQFPPALELVSLSQKMQSVLEDLELKISENNATIEVGRLAAVKGNGRQLQQLLQNLVDNALKYRRADVAPFIKVWSEPRVIDGKNYEALIVQDNGIGFEQKYVGKIFKMFQRLHARDEYSGTGVGLSIVQKVVENHKGVIEATGVPGEGATFTVYLPVDPAPAS